MARRRVVASVGTALVVAVALGALGSFAGFPPGSRVRIELFELPGPQGQVVGPPRDGILVDQLVEADPSHWGGSFVDGDALVATFVGVDEATARRALTEAGVSSAVRLEARRVSRAEADAVRDSIEGTGVMGSSVTGLGFDPYRSVVEVEARRPDLGLVERLEEATAGSDVPVRIHWRPDAPRAV
jgi:hypothetical protein